MGLVVLQVPEEQGTFVQVVLQYVLDPFIADRIGLQCPFTGIVQPLRAVGLVKLYDPNGTFIAYLRIVDIGDDLFHARRNVAAVGGRPVPEELRAPITIISVGTAQVVLLGVVRTFGTVARMQCDALAVVMDLHHVPGIMDNGLPADIPVGNAIVGLVRGKKYIPHFLYLSPAVILYLISV